MGKKSFAALAFALASCLFAVPAHALLGQQANTQGTVSSPQPEVELAEQAVKQELGPPELVMAVMAADGALEVSRFTTEIITRTTRGELPPGVTINVQQ